MAIKESIAGLLTEQRNPASSRIDRLSTLEMVHLINQEDHRVAEAVEAVCPDIADAIDHIVPAVAAGGRLIYCGCGTSGRLGILDAVECPPTYSVDPSMIQGIIAGGRDAVFQAVEGAEDNRESGRLDLMRISFTSGDVLVGIAASGRTPYVLGAMEYAKSLGAVVISVTCVPGSPIDQLADIGIAPTPGPEVVSGSTRMKSGTAQKMVLNMLSTGTMIKLGKVYGNLMVDVKASNEKLRMRCINIVCQATGADEKTAAEVLGRCGWRCKNAIVMLLLGLNSHEAEAALARSGGRIAAILEETGC